MDETIVRLEEEIKECLDQIEKLDPASAEYKYVFETMKSLEMLKEQRMRLLAELDKTERELTMEEKKSETESDEKAADRKVARWEHTSGIIKTGLIGLLTLAGTWITVKAEKDVVISDKGPSLVSKVKGLFR